MRAFEVVARAQQEAFPTGRLGSDVGRLKELESGQLATGMN